MLGDKEYFKCHDQQMIQEIGVAHTRPKYQRGGNSQYTVAIRSRNYLFDAIKPLLPWMLSVRV